MMAARTTPASVAIYFERPPGPNWHERLRDELIAEYAGHASPMAEETSAWVSQREVVGAAPSEQAPKPKAEPNRDTLVRVRAAHRVGRGKPKPKPMVTIAVSISLNAPRDTCIGCGKPFGEDRYRDWRDERLL